MKKFSPGVLNFYVAILVITLFSFKINVVAIGGSGLRLDDVIFIIGLPLLLFLFSNIEIRPEFRIFFIFLASSFLSLLLASYYGRISFLEGIFYWGRNIQYMGFFLIGLILAGYVNLTKIFKSYIIYVVAFLTLQYFNIMPTFSLFVGSGRAVANTGGPYELAVLAGLLAIYFWFQSNNKFYFFCALVILFLTQSRITLVALLLIMFFKAFKLGGKLAFLAVTTAAVFVLSLADLGVFDRFLTLFDAKTLEAGKLLFDGVPHFANTTDYRQWAFVDYGTSLGNSEGDISTYIRLIRQYSLFLSMQDCGVSCQLFGLGPSFASAAVDGNIVRLLVEYGLVGTLLFIYGIKKVVYSSGNVMLRHYFILLLITAIAIDILVSSKAMCLMWFLCGYYARNNPHAYVKSE